MLKNAAYAVIKNLARHADYTTEEGPPAICSRITSMTKLAAQICTQTVETEAIMLAPDRTHVQTGRIRRGQ